ncbi:unnamed protein product [Clonostachys solani]|uniref:Uncharacterized protein n=1 Tax=Clonostachys solani TaxID=160281 RepID=A0A9N9VWM7_9HYPO|nr:unnamed protein product [Clonostachys solani]
MAPSVEDIGLELGREALASRFYGPGFIACWYVLVISVGLSWVFNTWQRFRITNELIAAVAYPVAASAHLLYQTICFPSAKSQYLANNLANILMPEVNGPVSAGTESGVYVLDVSMEGREKIFPLVASINAALRIADNCIYLCLVSLVMVILAHHSPPKPPQFPHRPLLGVLLVSLFWTWMAEVVLFVKLLVYASHGLLPVHYSILHHLTFPVYLATALLLGPVSLMPLAVVVQCLVVASKQPNPWMYFDQLRSDAMKSWRMAKGEGRDTAFRLVLDIIKFTCAAVFFYGVLLFFEYTAWVMFPMQILFPDVRISVTEFDQVAVLVGGVLALSRNVYKITTAYVREHGKS